MALDIIDNRALRFRTQNPDKYSIIPKRHITPIDGGFEVLVSWGLEECKVLQNLGVKNVPHHIRRSYDWPGKYKPMAHQKETAGFVTMFPRCFVLNDAGTAKTISVLWAADYLMQQKKVRRCLVVCPLSIMHSAWMGDIMKSVIHRSAAVAHHSNVQKRVEVINGTYDFVIINYDGLNLVADDVKRNGEFDLIIVDEATNYSTATTRRWKSLNKILAPHTLLWMMTGTPAAQSPLQAYGLAKLVNPSGVPAYFTAWRDKVMHKLTMFKWVPKHDAREQVFKVLQPAIRFTKAQCLDLPPVITQVRHVEMTAQQNKYYKLIKEQMLASAAGETITAVNKAVVVSKLLQISCGAAYADGGDTIEFDAAPRMNTLLEILGETDRKVIIFALFRSSIDAIFTFLTKHDVETEVIHGGVSPTKRGAIVNRFQNTPTPRVLVMQPQATAHGLTLTAADTVVFFGPLMSVEQYVQCIARADRQGQVGDKVTVVQIQSSPIEKKMFDAMDDKVAAHALLTEMFDAETKGGKK